MNPAGGMKISFPCHVVSTQNGQWKSTKKKANEAETDTKERQREVTGTFSLHCEKDGDSHQHLRQILGRLTLKCSKF